MIKRIGKPKPFQEYEVICQVCERTFIAKRNHAETCSSSCRSYKSRHPEYFSTTYNKNTVCTQLQNLSTAPSIHKTEAIYKRELEAEKIEEVPIKLLNLRILKGDYGMSVACPLCGINHLTYLGFSRPMADKLWEYETHLKFQHNIINQSHLRASILALTSIFRRYDFCH